jgi:hypothetical protein
MERTSIRVVGYFSRESFNVSKAAFAEAERASSFQITGCRNSKFTCEYRFATGEQIL